MTKQNKTKQSVLLDRFLDWWSTVVLRFAWLVIILFVGICTASLHFTINNLGINTDTSTLLSQDLPFQKNRARWEQAFPNKNWNDICLMYNTYQ